MYMRLAWEKVQEDRLCGHGAGSISDEPDIYITIFIYIYMNMYMYMYIDTLQARLEKGFIRQSLPIWSRYIYIHLYK